MGFQHQLKKYAALVIAVGINIQKGQELVIRTPVECAEFARLLAKEAYERGAREVVLFWRDEKFSKIKYDYSPLEIFQKMPPWQAEFNNYYASRGAAFLTIDASDPELLADVDPAKIVAGVKASHQACKLFYDKIDSGELSWNIISVPTLAWAKKVFPECSDEEAMSQLWNAIFKAVRVDCEDPIKAWKQHKQSFQSKIEYLNKQQFKALHYQNSLGTDLYVGLPEHHIWEGGGDCTQNGIEFFPNMPTEEIFSTPHREQVHGVVYSSIPLNYNGNVIDRFSLTFKNGKVVEFHAEQGESILQHILDTDEGSRYLGEIALVPYDSPISNMKTLFYSTLFDENASCHLALGSCYPSCLENGTTMSKEELMASGGNDSVTHVDFMIGTKDLSIVGIKDDNTQVPIFIDGNWAI